MCLITPPPFSPTMASKVTWGEQGMEKHGSAIWELMRCRARGPRRPHLLNNYRELKAKLRACRPEFTKEIKPKKRKRNRKRKNNNTPSSPGSTKRIGSASPPQKGRRLPVALLRTELKGFRTSELQRGKHNLPEPFTAIDLTGEAWTGLTYLPSIPNVVIYLIAT